VIWADFGAIKSVHVLPIAIRQGLKVPVSPVAGLKTPLLTRFMGARERGFEPRNRPGRGFSFADFVQPLTTGPNMLKEDIFLFA